MEAISNLLLGLASLVAYVFLTLVGVATTILCFAIFMVALPVILVAVILFVALEAICNKF